MKHTALLSATLGLPASWYVIEAKLSEDTERIDLKIAVSPGANFKCPCCGCDARATNEAEETWYHDDFLNLQAYLTAQVPHVTCPKGCGLQRISPPWERAGSLFRLISGKTGPADSG